MKREYLLIDVYEATQRRLRYVFEEFDHIYVSFSGGKDSGLLLQMLLDFRRTHYPNRVIGVFHQDFEAQYTMTTEYVTKTFAKIAEDVEPYWICLPMATRTALSCYQMYWYPWDDTCSDRWVRPMPRFPYVVNLTNPFMYYHYRMHQEDLARQFSRYYRDLHGGGKTVCLLGIRADESLQRYSGFLNKRYGYKDQCWITRQFKNVWCASPMYDWTVHDVWTAYSKFGYEYNRLYDLYWKAGQTPDQMRVASPFNDSAKDNLNLYRVIDPEVWGKLIGRVNGANFGAIYGKSKAMGYHTVTLPKGHTWKTYTCFLLDTLPARLRSQYIRKFQTSILFWHNVGGGLPDETIDELRQKGYRIRLNGISNYTIGKKTRVIFEGPLPDDTDDIHNRDIPSWKRMCYCILKNDHLCRHMGFGLTRQEKARIDQIKMEYEEILHEK